MKRMFPKTILPLLCASFAIALGACSKSSAPEESATEAPTPLDEKAVSKKAAANPSINKANEALKAGAYDEAAARLLEARVASPNFSPGEAAAYRDTMQEAYTKAIEAAEKGDAKAKAALEMIRAARN